MKSLAGFGEGLLEQDVIVHVQTFVSLESGNVA